MQQELLGLAEQLAELGETKAYSSTNRPKRPFNRRTPEVLHGFFGQHSGTQREVSRLQFAFLMQAACWLYESEPLSEQPRDAQWLPFQAESSERLEAAYTKGEEEVQIGTSRNMADYWPSFPF